MANLIAIFSCECLVALHLTLFSVIVIDRKWLHYVERLIF